MTTPNRPTPGMDPAEGRDDLGIPGADTPGDEPDVQTPGGLGGPEGKVPGGEGRERERRDELADRVGSGGPSAAGGGRPDLIGGTDVPDGQM